MGTDTSKLLLIHEQGDISLEHEKAHALHCHCRPAQETDNMTDLLQQIINLVVRNKKYKPCCVNDFCGRSDRMPILPFFSKNDSEAMAAPPISAPTATVATAMVLSAPDLLQNVW